MTEDLTISDAVDSFLKQEEENQKILSTDTERDNGEKTAQCVKEPFLRHRRDKHRLPGRFPGGDNTSCLHVRTEELRTGDSRNDGIPGTWPDTAVPCA